MQEDHSQRPPAQPPDSNPAQADAQPCANGFQFRHLLDRLPAGAYTCDAQGLITYYNQQAVRLWGRAPNLNDPADRFCGSFKLFAADGSPIAHDHCWMALALRDGQEYNGQEIIVERPDGIRLTVLAHANPIRDESGRLLGAVNVLIDISDRKRGEEAQALLAAIVESSDDAIISKTLDGRILSWNGGAQRLFGYAASEAVGRSITLIVPPERQDEEQTILARLHRGERIEHYETVRLTKDGRRLDVSLTISPIRDSAGRIVAASKVGRDITARKQSDEALMALKDELATQVADLRRLQTELRDADRRKDEFLATLAHELRNPLAPIRNSLEILRLSDDLGPAALRVREIMQRQVDHMVRLVDDLMEVSRITRGKIDLRKEPVELVAVVRSAVETSKPLIDAAGHQLAITVSPEPMTLEADPMRLSQVIANLLNNAAKYTEDGGQIWLTARREGREAVVSVRDTGVGIPADMLPRVFDVFTQVNRTLNRAQGGLGIGLTLARNLVQLHGGRIDVHSEGEGRGSEFVVRLPLAANHSRHTPRAAPTDATRSAPATSASRRVLVVDDLPDAAQTLARLLQALGHQVCTAQNAAEALAVARSQRPEVVLSDIAMPDMDGYELARRLRQEPGMQDAMLVALTGYGQESDRRRTREAGYDSHLVKPVSLDDLQLLLASLPAPQADTPPAVSQNSAGS